MDEKQLMELVNLLNRADPCAVHGRRHLVLCMECREDIRCAACKVMTCQCWNDE